MKYLFATTLNDLLVWYRNGHLAIDPETYFLIESGDAKSSLEVQNFTDDFEIVLAELDLPNKPKNAAGVNLL